MANVKKYASAFAVAAVGVGGIAALVAPAGADSQCPTSGVITAPAPTFNDVEGWENDTVTIPESACVNYTLNTFDVAAGETYFLRNFAPYAHTNDSNGWNVATVVVQAEAKADHWQLTGTYKWQQGFIGSYGETPVQTMTGTPAHMRTPIQPLTPTFKNAEGLNPATVTIPEQNGVTYTIKGDKKSEVVAPGTYEVVNFASINNNGKATVTVTATSSDNRWFVIDGTNTWTQEVNAVLVSGVTSPAIADGTYVITSALNGNKALDVNGGTKKNGENVQLWDRNNGKAQRFQVTHLGNNEYSIINVYSGKALDINGGSKKAGANVHQWTWSGSGNQRFVITPAKNGGYTIKVVSSSLLLDVTGSSTANGANVIQWTDNGGHANQRWNFNADAQTPAPTPKPTVTTPAPAPTTVAPAPKPTTTAPAPKPSTTAPAPKPTTSAPVKRVTFVAPTFNHAHNTYTIPNAEGVQYYVGSTPVAAGTYNVASWDAQGNATVTVKATVKAGYVSADGYVSRTWSAGYIRTVQAQAPSFNVTGKKASDTFVIPSTTGVDYYANGKKVAAGTHKVADYAEYKVTTKYGTFEISSATLVVEARAQQGYQVSGYYKWTQEFASSDNPNVIVNPGNQANLKQVTPAEPSYSAGWNFLFVNAPAKYTIPKVTGVDYYVNGNLTPAGTYQIAAGQTVKIEAKPQAGYTFPYNTVTTNQWTYYSR